MGFGGSTVKKVGAQKFRQAGFLISRTSAVGGWWWWWGGPKILRFMLNSGVYTKRERFGKYRITQNAIKKNGGYENIRKITL